MKEIINQLDNIEIFDTENDYEFFKRVYNNGDLKKYVNRLKAIGFQNLENVLDHGCGFGQWSFSLAKLNKDVNAYDISDKRIKVANQIKAKVNAQNINFISEIDYNDSSSFCQYDAIFSYGVLQCVDYKDMLKAYHRFLKPKGKLYFTGADLGWYMHCIVNGHNDTSDFSSKQWGINAISNTINYLSGGEFKVGSNICIPYKFIEQVLEKLGFNIISIGADGSTNITDDITCESFFPFEKQNHVAVYEVLCEKIN